jgi:hypothetical protein
MDFKLFEKEIKDISGDSMDLSNKKYINIIYHNDYLKTSKFINSIINEYNYFESKINGASILTDCLPNLLLVLEIIRKNKLKSKFFLIINGRSSIKTIEYIIEHNYDSLFLGSIIFTSNINGYSDFQKKYSDFVKGICVRQNQVVDSIFNCFNEENITNDNIFINKLINKELSKDKLISLKTELVNLHGDESENSFNENFEKIKEFIKESEFPNEIKSDLINDFKIFSELMNKNYKKIIEYYLNLNNYNFVKIINLLLDKKDKSIYNKIGYFAGNLMYCLEEYGKKENKEVKSTKTFYRGTQLNIIDVLEYLKNIQSSIIFPYFLSMTTKKNLAEKFSKRNISGEERKQKEIFSVIFQIEYIYKANEQPCAFELKDLSPNPAEDEHILLPFTFLKVKSVTIDSNKFLAYIVLEKQSE